MPMSTPLRPAACMARPVPAAMPVCSMALACWSRSLASCLCCSALARSLAVCSVIAAFVAAMSPRRRCDCAPSSRVLMPAALRRVRSCCSFSCCWVCCAVSAAASRLARAMSRSMARVGGPAWPYARASAPTLAWASVSLAAVSCRLDLRVRNSPTWAC